ncbi:MAG TPA: ATP-binding cassette domain-containing protein [Thermoanaerobaculales bacterium]|nr:ATP-binding cassette domain-containing protein [Thermoanaerobaculales bacterium]HPA80612.1 ATP-binding cassette domain-containing protein [Thermoanaerobaculales bacterium]HQL30028.1 ATP-binding cassette domain-containing protein [Thermoanaerobaculales bacterium]HQN97562.1 ATP-binding cassette domain-containing protein [Thermoanaerobaculales bacterium]HQP44098.1 ATP-binding cassette domain-containing protein [Thermoanaerobaculales bacterium]
MADAILELHHLSKRYGDYLAVDDLSFAVPQGSVYGLLGPNGAGKTTTIRMIMRIIAPDSGEVLLDGGPVDDDRRRLIGYLPEERGLYRKMKVLEHLVYLGTIRGVSPGEARKRAAAWLERLELTSWTGHKVEDLSKGMQQKLQLIGTLLHRPRLLILDEPFSGLDPINTRALKDLLLAMAGDGVTIVLSTHVLPQVDELCTHICLINRARAILAGTLGEIRAQYGGNVWRVRTELGADAVAGLPGVRSVRSFGEELLVELDGSAGPRELLRELVQRGGIDSFTRFVPDLENIFIRAVEEDRSDVG